MKASPASMTHSSDPILNCNFPDNTIPACSCGWLCAGTSLPSSISRKESSKFSPVTMPLNAPGNSCILGRFSEAINGIFSLSNWMSHGKTACRMSIGIDGNFARLNVYAKWHTTPIKSWLAHSTLCRIINVLFAFSFLVLFCLFQHFLKRPPIKASPPPPTIKNSIDPQNDTLNKAADFELPRRPVH